MSSLHRFQYVVATLVVFCVSQGFSDEIDLPQVLDPAWELQQIAAEPELVTPISCRFDARGRLLVVESHTHFPPENYAGPKTDRIYLFDQLDENASGKVTSRRRTFHEGGVATMGMAVLDDGWIAVATRREVFKLRDSDGDDIADQRVTLLVLESEANYPHNGLAGLAVGPDGLLYVGEGENLGSPYRLIATDGSQQIGHGEGGNIFRCTKDGTKLERVATGFWNPFGLYFDPVGRLWTVENDPDARPPCRLLHVVLGGDYGFEFRFGRSGTHPLIAWDGELPGTLPMVAGTDEAPCAVLGVDKSLWVTSWGSHRIERFQLQPRGASWVATMDVVVQGDSNFRPVDLAVSHDGSVYFTDWVDRSYPIHGKGRLWRLRKRTIDTQPSSWPELTSEEVRVNELSLGAALTKENCFAGLADQDSFVRQAAVSGLINSGLLPQLTWQDALGPRQQIGLLRAWHWQDLVAPDSLTSADRQTWIAQGLQVDAEEVALFAVRWASERQEIGQLPAIKSILQREKISTELFGGVVAAISYLENGSAREQLDPAREKLLYKFAADKDRNARLRAMAIQQIPSKSTEPNDTELFNWISGTSDRELGGAAVRLLAERATKSALDQLAAVAGDESVMEQVRADALAGLSKNAGEYGVVINKLSLPRQSTVLRTEASRVLRRDWSSQIETRPQPHDLIGWSHLMEKPGDADAGRRVFFRSTCANCHVHSGRGSRVGPDLSKIAAKMSRERLLESILIPSREVGPLYVPWRVLTEDGKILTGMKLDKSGAGDSVSFLGAEGGEFQIKMADIESWEPTKQSIMPDGLEIAMPVDEFRDLICFLLNGESNELLNNSHRQ